MSQDPNPPMDAPTYQARLEAVLESVTDGVYAVDRDWRFVIFNAAAETYFGTRRGDVLGRTLAEVFPQGAGTKFERLCRAAMDDGVASTMQAPSRLRPGRILELKLSPMRGGGFAVALNDVTDRELAEERRQLMLNELNHRVKNTLATVQAIANQSLRGPQVADEARERFKGRLMALSRANDMVVEGAWRGATLGAVAAEIAAPFGGVDPGRFAVVGPEVRLQAEMVVAMTLALHELATNSAKYGALSAASGHVDLDWTWDDAVFRLSWRETGGPPVTPPAHRGFGDRLIRDGLGRAVRGNVELDYAPAGLVCVVTGQRAALGPQA